MGEGDRREDRAPDGAEHRGVSRRLFLKTSGAAALGAASFVACRPPPYLGGDPEEVMA